MKYRLYSTLTGWTSRNESLESHLGIPDGNTVRYAEVLQVANPDNADYEKYIMPVCAKGTWKCDDQFNASDLVNYDPDWFSPLPE
jgi:hypothetical protein